MSDTTPGWHPDPTGRHDHRYWDGSQWSEHVADAGVSGTDPLDAVAPEASTAHEAAPVEEPAAADEAPAPEEPVPADEPTLADEPAPVDEPAPIEPVDETTVDQPTPGEAATATYPTTSAFPPAADEPAAWPTDAGYGAPAPPPPYVPGDPGSSGGGDSRKGLLIGGGLLVAIALIVIAFLAFGGDDDDGPSAQDNVSDTDTTAGDGSDETTPPGDGSEGSYGSDAALDELWDACADGDFAACDQLYLDSPVDSDYETFGDTCGDRAEPSGTLCVVQFGEGVGETDGTDGTDVPPNFEETLADTWESTLGLDRDQAECLAEKSAEAIEEGTLDEADAASGFLSFLSDCDIDLEEIGSN